MTPLTQPFFDLLAARNTAQQERLASPKKMKVYLAGPMTGYPDFNYPAFHEQAALLRADGYDVLNPAERFAGDQTLPYATYMRAAIEALLQAEAIYTLPGWLHSKGARMEVLLAERLGLPHLNATDTDRLCRLDVWRIGKGLQELQVTDGTTQSLN